MSMAKYYYLRVRCSRRYVKEYYTYYAESIAGVKHVLDYKEAKVLTSIEADNIMKNSRLAWEKVEGKVKTVRQFI